MAAAPDDDARRTLAELEAKLRELERELLRGYEPETIDADPFAATDEGEADLAPPAPLRPDEPVAAPDEPAAAPDESVAAPDEPAAAQGGFDASEWVVSEPREEVDPEPAYAPEPAPAAEAPPVFEAEPEREPAFAPEPEPEPAADAAPEPVFEAEPEREPIFAPEPEPEPAREPVATLDHDALNVARDLLASLRSTVEDMGLTAGRITAEAQAVADDHGRTLGRLARAAQAAARAEDAAIEAGRLAATVVVEAGPFADAGAVKALRDALAAQPGARDAYVRGVEDGRAVIEVHLAPPPA